MEYLTNASSVTHLSMTYALAAHETPLYIAASKGRLKVVRSLLAAGAAVNQANQAGETPLYAAANIGYLEIAQLLLQHKAAVDQANNAGNTPFQRAVLGGAGNGAATVGE